MSANPDKSQSPALLSLPAEIREEIYRLVLVEPVKWDKRHEDSCAFYKESLKWDRTWIYGPGTCMRCRRTAFPCGPTSSSLRPEIHPNYISPCGQRCSTRYSCGHWIIPSTEDDRQKPHDMQRDAAFWHQPTHFYDTIPNRPPVFSRFFFNQWWFNSWREVGGRRIGPTQPLYPEPSPHMICIRCFNPDFDRPCECAPRKGLSLRLACRQISQEASYIFYTENTFTFHHSSLLTGFLQNTSPSYLALIRQVSLMAYTLGKWNFSRELNDRQMRKYETWEMLREKCTGIRELELDSIFLNWAGAIRCILKLAGIPKATFVQLGDWEEQFSDNRIWPEFEARVNCVLLPEPTPWRGYRVYSSWVGEGPDRKIASMLGVKRARDGMYKREDLVRAVVEDIKKVRYKGTLNIQALFEEELDSNEQERGHK